MVALLRLSLHSSIFKIVCNAAGTNTTQNKTSFMQFWRARLACQFQRISKDVLTTLCLQRATGFRRHTLRCATQEDDFLHILPRPAPRRTSSFGKFEYEAQQLILHNPLTLLVLCYVLLKHILVCMTVVDNLLQKDKIWGGKSW